MASNSTQGSYLKRGWEANSNNGVITSYTKGRIIALHTACGWVIVDKVTRGRSEHYTSCARAIAAGENILKALSLCGSGSHSAGVS